MTDSITNALVKRKALDCSLTSLNLTLRKSPVSNTEYLAIFWTTIYLCVHLTDSPGAAEIEGPSSVREGDDATLTCSAIDLGKPTGTFHWVKPSGEEQTGPGLEIRNAEVGVDDGRYTCYVGNGLYNGTAADHTIIVEGKRKFKFHYCYCTFAFHRQFPSSNQPAIQSHSSEHPSDMDPIGLHPSHNRVLTGQPVFVSGQHLSQ